MIIRLVTLLGAMCLFSFNLAWAGDSHANYYYPEPTSRETYAANVKIGSDANRHSRIGFTVGLNEEQQKRGYAPRYHIFAKGANAQKLILVATGDDTYDTLYRLRALMASLTSDARATPIFDSLELASDLNFLDLCKLIGFEQITISDGDKLAHRIDIR